MPVDHFVSRNSIRTWNFNFQMSIIFMFFVIYVWKVSNMCWYMCPVLELCVCVCVCVCVCMYIYSHTQTRTHTRLNMCMQGGSIENWTQMHSKVHGLTYSALYMIKISVLGLVRCGLQNRESELTWWLWLPF